ncbi:MAG: DUF4832 domain-containing protein [Planctomycetota bacterium]|nr:DUF4832 domain-containing protein [Planctomycetota bacterium]
MAGSKRTRAAKTKASKKHELLTTKQVVDAIMQVIEALPEQVKGLPPELRTRTHWQKALAPTNKRAEPVMDVLRELPAFTNHAPKKSTAAEWTKVFEKHMGLYQIAQTLREANHVATFKPVKRRIVSHWRDAFGPKEYVQRVRPQESFGYLPNPHRGTTTFQRFQGEDTYPSFITSDTYGPLTYPTDGSRANVKFVPRTTLTYCRWPWAWLEPEKGKFRWDIVDGTLAAARACGQTAQLRFQPYTIPIKYAERPTKAKRHPPEASVDLPDWYWDTGAPWITEGTYAKHEPDSNDPLYLKHFGDFIRAFAKRYDGHPDLESIDVSYAGFWGESGGNTTDETAQKLADIYLAHFKKTTLLSMLGTAGCVHAAKISNATGRPIGWRADCFGDLRQGNSPDVPARLSWNHTYDAYPKEISDNGLKDAWKTAPVTMETCGNVATWVMHGYDVDRIIEEGYCYHMSVFMPKNVFFPEKVLEKLLAFDLKIGYRFELRQALLPIQAKAGGKITVEFFTANVGVAPIYRPYKLALRFLQGKKARVVTFDQDIRTWLPGHNFFRETIAVPKDLERGDVKVAVGIVDETETPRVWFAIDEPLDAGWHPLTGMEVV